MSAFCTTVIPWRGVRFQAVLTAILILLLLWNVLTFYTDEGTAEPASKNHGPGNSGEDHLNGLHRALDYDNLIQPGFSKPPPTPPVKNPVNWTQLLWFAPKDLNDCRELFPHGMHKVPLPPNYGETSEKFRIYLRGMMNNLRIKNIEGHSGEQPEQTSAYMSIANASFVRTVCETGFNAGHSTLAWLSANPSLKVYSFDLGVHKYSHPMASFLSSVFPDRLVVTWGDSQATLPGFLRDRPTMRRSCDIIIVDGGHYYGIAKADLENFRPLANPAHHILVIDDHPTRVVPGVRKAWEDQVKAGRIKERFKCTYYPRGQRGFTIGEYTKLEEDRDPFY